MISIIVPVYNVEKYITKCLESIVNQDYKDFELILVNDGSKDNSINLANGYLKDKDIKWSIINKENGGLASARNAGLKVAKGEYISFIDSDDYISTDFLTTLLQALIKENADYSFCAFEFVKKQEIDIDSNDKEILFNKDELLKTFLKRTINFVVPSMLFKKEFLDKNELSFNEALRFSEDQPFIWNVILNTNKAIYLYKKMYGYYIRENSIMTSTSLDKIINSFKEYSTYTKDLFSKYPEYKDITDKVLPRWELGTLYTCAKLLDYENYKKVYEAMDGKSILKRIKGIDENKAYLLGFVCSMSSKLMYKLCRMMELNK